MPRRMTAEQAVSPLTTKTVNGEQRVLEGEGPLGDMDMTLIFLEGISPESLEGFCAIQ